MNYLKLFSIALSVILFASCGDKDVYVTAVEITSTPSPLILTVGGDTGKVEAAVLPADATDKTITWSVAPEGVVTVAADGTVTAVAAGSATITATAANGINGTCSVMVGDVDIYTGTLNVMAGTENEFILEDVEVIFTVAGDEATADVEMLNVKFAVGMPVALDVLISGVTLTPTTGGYTVSCGEEGIVPTFMNGRPFPDKIITELEGSVTATTMSLAMKSGGDPLTFEGTATAE